MIDLRSDTVTQPTAEMRTAMAEAIVGDDVYGEDPTINELEARAAELTGKQAALFVASGTMGNQLALMAHTRHGQEIILEASSHILINEAGGAAALSGLQTRPIAGQLGCMPCEEIEAAIRTVDIHYPQTGLICLENTHNAHGGVALPLEYLRQVQALAYRQRIPVHMDGARLFNAALALGVTARDVAAYADSVTFCLSKGLGAPVGSLLCGESDFIQRARALRKRIGGGMRQAGILAAAGLIALTSGVARLREDHANARRLAIGLSVMPGVDIDLNTVQTNIVYFCFTLNMDGVRFASDMEKEGIRVSAMPGKRMRMVIHQHISAQDIDTTLEAMRAVLRRAKSSSSN